MLRGSGIQGEGRSRGARSAFVQLCPPSFSVCRAQRRHFVHDGLLHPHNLNSAFHLPLDSACCQSSSPVLIEPLLCPLLPLLSYMYYFFPLEYSLLLADLKHGAGTLFSLASFPSQASFDLSPLDRAPVDQTYHPETTVALIASTRTVSTMPRC